MIKEQCIGLAILRALACPNSVVAPSFMNSLGSPCGDAGKRHVPARPKGNATIPLFQLFQLFLCGRFQPAGVKRHRGL